MRWRSKPCVMSMYLTSLFVFLHAYPFKCMKMMGLSVQCNTRVDRCILRKFLEVVTNALSGPHHRNKL